MKKLILTALTCILFSAFAFAEIKPIVAFKPYVNWDNSPAALSSDAENLKEWSLSDTWWMNKQDYLYNVFQIPSVLDLGMELNTDLVNLVFRIDVRQDTLQLLQDDGKFFTNIPFVDGLIDLNFPHVGFIDFTWNNFFLSIGRRQIKWGPTTYDMALSDSQPYLDNVFFSYDAPVNNTGWNFNYSFTGVGFRYFLAYSDTPNHENNEGPKSLFTHRFRFENDFLRFAVAELNIVYDKDPNLLDFSPLSVWHNSYQDDYSNVMLNFSAEGLVGPVRLMGTFTMDDFDLPHEISEDWGLSNKPQAFGFTAGAEVNLLDGKKIDKVAFDYNDYAIVEKTFKKETGLNVGYEFYYCSTFMYNRNNTAGKYTTPFQFISLAGGSYCFDRAAFYTGFKYGPSTMVNRLYAEYTNNPLYAYFTTEIITRGSYGIESFYGNNQTYYEMGLKTMKLTDPVTTAIKIEGGAAYYIQKGLKLNGSAGVTIDATHKTSAYNLRIGAAFDLCTIDWKALFNK